MKVLIDNGAGINERKAEIYVIGTCLVVEDGDGRRPARIKPTQEQWKLLAQSAARVAKGEEL